MVIVNWVVTSKLIKLFFEPETVAPLKISIGLNEERINEGYKPATISTIMVNRKSLAINSYEMGISNCSDKSLLNQGRIYQTTIRARMVAANVWKTDSAINCLKMSILLAPFTFFMPISTERSEARATDNTEKLREAISIIKDASPDKIHIWL